MAAFWAAVMGMGLIGYLLGGFWYHDTHGLFVGIMVFGMTVGFIGACDEASKS